jgi:glycosyltransferase involved in cell wall biosynthesis
MSDPSSLRASVLITNFDYGRFLGYAIDSALAQTWPNVQIVVVDDGSRDHSRALLESYGDEIQTVLKKNGGQSSAVNAGIPLLTGDAVILLDSDDMLDPTAIEKSIGFFADPAIVKVHWPMATVDRNGYPTGQIRWNKLPSGDLRATALKVGPASHTTPACSANIWRRSFLEALAPLPTGGELRNCTDSWLFTMSPFFGTFAALTEPLTFYRVHGNNISTRYAAGPRLANWEQRAELLHAWLRKEGDPVSIDRWRRRYKYDLRLA